MKVYYKRSLTKLCYSKALYLALNNKRERVYFIHVSNTIKRFEEVAAIVQM